MASNNDSGMRYYDMERFQLFKHFQFEWPVNIGFFSFLAISVTLMFYLDLLVGDIITRYIFLHKLSANEIYRIQTSLLIQLQLGYVTRTKSVTTESILLRLLGYVTRTKKATSTKENTQMTEFTIHTSFKIIVYLGEVNLSKSRHIVENMKMREIKAHNS
jgi:hypothetical protein